MDNALSIDYESSSLGLYRPDCEILAQHEILSDDFARALRLFLTPTDSLHMTITYPWIVCAAQEEADHY